MIVQKRVQTIAENRKYQNQLQNQALYRSKNPGKGIYTVWDARQEESPEKGEDDRVFFTDELHYLNNKIKVIVEKNQQLRSERMVNNKPIGFVSGFCEEGFPIYSLNGFFPDLFGSTMDEFEARAEKGFYYIVTRAKRQQNDQEKC